VVCFADTVFLTDGRKIEGEIIEETPEKYFVKTKYGVQEIDKIDVANVERKKSDRQIYEEQKNSAKDAESHYKLAQWCKEKGLTREAEEELKKTIELNPNHEKARKELGFQKVGDKWLTEDEAMEAKGFKKWEGSWVSESEYQELLKKKEEKDKLEEQKRQEEQKNAVEKAQEKSKKEYEGVPWEQCVPMETEHFTIKCNSTKEVAEKYKKLMEWLYQKYSTIFADFRPLDKKCTIEIRRNHQEFMEAYHAPPGIGGFYQNGQFILNTFHGAFGITSDTSTVLAHEGCHLFQDLIGMFGPPDPRKGGKSPIWLVEGMAVVFEAAHVDWKTGKIRLRGVSRDRFVILKREIEDKKALSLADVLNTPHGQFSGRHYGYAGMFTYWLVAGATEKHQILYNEYVKIATGWEGRPGRKIQPGEFESLLQKYLGKTLAEVEQDWQRWVLKQKVEKLGAMKGNKYVSKETGFEVERPDPAWKVDTEEDLEGSEQVAFSNKKTTGRISVSAEANYMNSSLESYKAELARNIERATQEGKLKDYKLISENTYTLKGQEVYDRVFEASNPESRINTALQKRRTVIFIMVDDIYSVRLMCDPDKFEENNQVFEKVLQSFQIYLK
jgi:hypothetical protein